MIPSFGKDVLGETFDLFQFSFLHLKGVSSKESLDLAHIGYHHVGVQYHPGSFKVYLKDLLVYGLQIYHNLVLMFEVASSLKDPLENSFQTSYAFE